jgi:hypothetical protein
MMNHPTPFEEVTSEQPWPAYWKLLPGACCCDVLLAGWELATAACDVPTAGWEEANAGRSRARSTRRKGGGGGIYLFATVMTFAREK